MSNWVYHRFKHHVADSGVKNALARAGSRIIGMSATRLRRLSERLVDPAAANDRLPLALAQQLKANETFSGKFADEKALILGSGPSASNLDSEVSSGRAIIAVNEMFMRVQALDLKLTAVVLHDPIYFDGTAEMNRMLADASEAVARDSGHLIIPAVYVPRLDALKLAQHRSIITFFSSGLPIAAVPRRDNLFDLSRAIPSLHTVSHAALIASLYLGFKEIAMLGVDLNFVGSPATPLSHGYGRNPYYEAINTHSAADAFRKGHGWDWPFVLRDVAEQLEGFDLIAEAAKRHGRRIVNLSAGSLLTTVASIDQEHVS